jgi:hypothetical protein
MSVKPLLNQLELSFWQFLIPLMHNSALVKTIGPHFYKVSENLWQFMPIILLYLCFVSGATIILLIDLIY